MVELNLRCKLHSVVNVEITLRQFWDFLLFFLYKNSYQYSAVVA